jgi:FKBP-type peptidyl-prolyl cis-trans isomerase SlyD
MPTSFEIMIVQHRVVVNPGLRRICSGCRLADIRRGSLAGEIGGRMKFTVVALSALVLAFGVVHAQAEEQPMSPAIETGSTVRLEYILKDDTGQILDSNNGRDPLTYTQGEEQILPGLEKALTGMRAGEQKQITVKPEEGYRPVDPAAQTEVPKEMLPPNALTVGTQLTARNPGGQSTLVRVKEIKEKTVIIDLNHPLAGQTLHFDVKVLGVEPPKK